MAKKSKNLSCLWLLITILSLPVLVFILFLSLFHDLRDLKCFVPYSDTTEIREKSTIWADSSGVSLFAVKTRPANSLVGTGSYLLFYDTRDSIGYTLYEYGPLFAIKSDTLLIFNENRNRIKRSFSLLSLAKQLKEHPNEICSD